MILCPVCGTAPDEPRGYANAVSCECGRLKAWWDRLRIDTTWGFRRDREGRTNELLLCPFRGLVLSKSGCIVSAEIVSWQVADFVDRACLVEIDSVMSS